MMTNGFGAREVVLNLLEMITGLRMNHAYIRPGGLAQDIPPGALDTRARGDPRAAPLHRRPRGAREREPDRQGAPGRRRLPRPRRLHGARHHRPDPALHRPAATTCASPSPTAATRPTTSTCRRATAATPTAGSGSAIDEMYESLRIVGAVRRPAAGDGARPGDGGRPQDRLAGAARPRRRRHGQQPRPHPRDHGHLDGGPDPPLQAGHRGLPGAGRPGVPGRRVRQGRARRAPGQSDGGTKPYRAHFRDPSFNNLQAVAAMCEGGSIADVIVAVASIDPVMGGVDR